MIDCKETEFDNNALWEQEERIIQQTKGSNRRLSDNDEANTSSSHLNKSEPKKDRSRQRLGTLRDLSNSFASK